METGTKDHVSFFLAGKRSGPGVRSIDGLGLRPAALARFGDLSELRHDFPLVLTDSPAGPPVVSLSGLFDDLLGETAEGSGAEILRYHALRLERRIRTAARPGARITLTDLWSEAERSLGEDRDPQIAESLARLRKALRVDGVVVGCDGDLPSQFLTHAWRVSRDEKTRRMRDIIDRLVVGLCDVLRADDANSPAAYTPEHLRHSMGAGFANEIDFTEMSKLLTVARPMVSLSRSRRARIERLVSILESQAFFPAGEESENVAGNVAGYSFAFRSFADALEAYRDRLPQMGELAKAIAAAKLEIDGKYRDDVHDAMFDAAGTGELDPAEVAQFPDYFVHVRADTLSAAESARLTEILSGGLPVKVLLQIDDLSAPPAGAAPALALARQFAHGAMGIGGVYVLQSTSSHLYRLRDDVLRGLAFEGPALFSVYSGANGSNGDLAPYLVSAVALESRAFPAFTYDPWRGTDWASRFSIALNPQAELDWPVHRIAFEEESLRRTSADMPFTFVDFLACDDRYAAHFASVPREDWNGSMVSVPDGMWDDGAPGLVPYVLMVDKENVLHRVIVGRRLVREARKCREQWRSLQELGGIHNSHALRLLERELAAWEESARRDAESRETKETPARDAPATVTAETVASSSTTAEPAEKKTSGDPFIETPRCSSCNECIKINDRMFRYDRNKQAYIADPSAGTYGQLVLAAESCQVAIIHPGRPRDPNEPGLEQLLERAKPFL
jgi:hypothetical protein